MRVFVNLEYCAQLYIKELEYRTVCRLFFFTYQSIVSVITLWVSVFFAPPPPPPKKKK